MSDSIINGGDPGFDKAGMHLSLEPRVRPIEPIDNLLAFASVKVAGVLVIDNMKVVAGEKGLFVDMPSIRGADDKYHDVAFPVTQEFRSRLQSAVLDQYNRAVEKMQGIGQAHAEKRSMSEQLAAGRQQATAHNVARPALATGAPKRGGEALG